VQIPSIKPDEILVKVKAASLCHSDLMLFEPNEQGLTLGEDKPFTMVRCCNIRQETPV
jgi:propanol-preferring alcohol dehydrogenase